MLEFVPEVRNQEPTGVELTLYTGQEFFRSLSRDISATEAGDRIAITTMDFDAGDPLVADVMENLDAAAARGANVDFAADAFALLNPRRTFGPVVLPFPMNQEVRKRRLEPLERLGQMATARSSITNVPNEPVWNYFARRSHIKLAVVKNKIYLGGPSLQGSDRIDMVVGFEDEQAADMLHGLASDIVAFEDTSLALGSEDRAWVMDDTTSIMIDAGVPGQSSILEEAVRIIDEAEQRLTISSPFLLTGIASEHLVQAHRERDVDVHIAYNHVSKYEQMRFAHRLILLGQRLRRPAAFFAHPVPRELPALHAKVVASERAAMLTSHNIVETGVKFGTPEIALVRRHPVFAAAVSDLLLAQVQAPLTQAAYADQRAGSIMHAPVGKRC